MRPYYLVNNLCVCCGAPVSEGRQVCRECENQAGVSPFAGEDVKNRPAGSARVPPPGKKFRLAARAAKGGDSS